jgi:hypothetical protein
MKENKATFYEIDNRKYVCLEYNTKVIDSEGEKQDCMVTIYKLDITNPCNIQLVANNNQEYYCFGFETL